MKPNRFAQDCITCGVRVDRGAGSLGKVAGKWVTYCAAHSSEQPEDPPVMVNPEDPYKHFSAPIEEPMPSETPIMPIIDKMARENRETRTDAALNVAHMLLKLTEKPALDETRVRELIAEFATSPEPVYREKIIVVANGSQVELPDMPRHEAFSDLLTAVACGLNVMLVGPAGSGKTTAAEQVAEALGLTFYPCGAIASEFKLSGYKDANGNYHRTPFRDAFEHGGEFLLDEYDGSIPNATLFLQQALANGHCAFPDGVIRKHPDFRCIAACNTYGKGADRVYVGRNQQDGAQLDRFIVIDWDYDEKLERSLYGDTAWTDRVQSVRKAVETLKLRHVVSPRATDYGKRLLESGMPQAKVEKLTIWKGLEKDQIEKVNAAV